MEKISLRKENSVAKVVGTMLCIVGALVATLYHGPPVLFVASQPSDEHLRRPPLSPQRRPSANSDWIIGGGLIVLENILVPISYIVQTQIMREYPSQFRVTNFYAVCVSVLCALVSLIAEKNNPNAWIITSQLSLICIVAAGVQNLGYVVIHLWVVRYKGPVFIAMFRPLSIIIAIIMGAIFLGNSLYLGSLIGGMLISIGFYTVMWGKAKEEEEKVIELPPSGKVPLLINYKR